MYFYLTIPAAIPLIAATSTDELRLLFLAALTLGQILLQKVLGRRRFAAQSRRQGDLLLMLQSVVIIVILIDHQPIDAVIGLLLVVLQLPNNI